MFHRPELVAELITDLLVFVNRDDLPILAQAAIAHAQFEPIHPFTRSPMGMGGSDATDQRSAAPPRPHPPSHRTAGLGHAADTGRYFMHLNRFRNGNVDAFVESLAIGAIHASEAAQDSALALADLLARHRPPAYQLGG